MKLAINIKGNSTVVMMGSEEPILRSVQDALEIMASVRYEYKSQKIILEKSCLSEEFFSLQSGMAGEILQKFTNYRIALAIIGDFSGYKSKSLHDFIYECNRGSQVFFLPDKATALEKLHSLTE